MKLDRLLAIVMLLVNREKISAKELARRFEVSVRTIYRDIETINEAGIPVYATQGANGGIGIMENFKMDRNVLTPDEITSIIMALKGMSTAMDDRKIQDTVEKMRGLSGRIGQESSSPRSDRIIIDFNPWGADRRDKEKFNLIRNAINENRVIIFTYLNARNEQLERQVEPDALVFRGSFWYLYGYCRVRESNRIFKLSRMRNLKKSEEKFDPAFRKAADVAKDNNFGDEKPVVDIVMRFSPSVRVRVEDGFGPESIEYCGDGTLIVRASFPEDEWVYGTILSYGENVEVLEPEHIRRIIREKAGRVYEKYPEYFESEN